MAREMRRTGTHRTSRMKLCRGPGENPIAHSEWNVSGLRGIGGTSWHCGIVECRHDTRVSANCERARIWTRTAPYSCANSRGIILQPRSTASDIDPPQFQANHKPEYALSLFRIRATRLSHFPAFRRYPPDCHAPSGSRRDRLIDGTKRRSPRCRGSVIPSLLQKCDS